MKKAVLWFLTIFFMVAVLTYMPSLASLIFLIVAVMILPIKKWQEIIKGSLPKKLVKFKTWIIVVAAFGGIMIAPVPEPGISDDGSAVKETTRDNESLGREDDLSGEVTSDTNIQGENAGVSDELQTAISVEKESYFEVHYLDVGEADAALVICDGEAMLVDGGNTNDSSFLYSYLREQEITYLSYIVASHAHEDHVGGIAGALNFAEVGVVYCPVKEYDSEPFHDFLKYVEKQNKTLTVPVVGEVFALGSAKVEVVGVNSGEAVNDTSIVIRITYGDTAFLFTGDLETTGEKMVLSGEGALNSTVLKVSHHGSADASSEEFLKTVSPEYAIISVGSSNAVGHPHEKVLNRLKDMGAEVYRTDLQGTIIASSDGKEVTIVVEKNVDADTFAPGATATPDAVVTAQPTGAPEETREPEGTVTSEPIVMPEATVMPEPAVTPEATMAPVPEIIFIPTGTAEPGDRNLVEVLPEETAVPIETQAPMLEEKTYVLNTNTMKFHKPDCRHVDDIKPHNYAEFVGAYEEVIGMGYVGCKVCKPR